MFIIKFTFNCLIAASVSPMWNDFIYYNNLAFNLKLLLCSAVEEFPLLSSRNSGDIFWVGTQPYHCIPGRADSIHHVYYRIYAPHLQVLHTFHGCVPFLQVDAWITINGNYSSTIIKQWCISGIEIKLTFSLLLSTTKGANCRY